MRFRAEKENCRATSYYRNCSTKEICCPRMPEHRERSYSAVKRATTTDRGKGKVNYIGKDMKMPSCLVIRDLPGLQ